MGSFCSKCCDDSDSESNSLLEDQKYRSTANNGSENTNDDELQRLKDENSKLHAEVSKYKQLTDNYKDKNSQLHAQLLQKKEKSIDTGIHQLKQEMEQFKKQEEILREQLKQKNLQIEELSNNLAKEMSTKVAADESSLENVAIKNRPINIADDYNGFCANEWLNAKESMDNALPDDTDCSKLQMLAHIISAVEDQVNNQVEEVFHRRDTFFSQLGQPAVDKDVQQQQGTKDQPEIQSNTSEMINAIGDYMRNISDSVDLTPMTEKVRESINKQTSDLHGKQFLSLWDKTKQSPALQVYIDVLSRITWKMVLQRPGMHFQHPTESYEESYYELYWNSEKDNHKAVVIEVYPALFQSKQLMAKGKVLLTDRSKPMLEQEEKK